MREDRPTLRDSLRVRAVYDGPTLVAVAPLMLSERPAVGPLRARYLQFIGADANMTELRAILALPEHARDAHHSVCEDLRREDGWDWMRWSGLRPGTADAVMPHLRVEAPSVPAYHLRLAPTWEAFRAGLGRNIKESLRKCYNSLERDGKQPTLRVARTPAEVNASLPRFFELHRARAEASGGVPHNNVFSTGPSRSFLREVCERLARRDMARVFELVVDDGVVASRIGFQFPRELYLYYSGYDPAYGRYSVMTTCLAESIRYAIAQRLDHVNLSTGTDVSKTRWGPERVVYGEGVQFAPGPRSRLAYEAMRCANYALRNAAVLAVLGRFLSRRHLRGIL
jgi:CelD/BcsL family acetyltransferase involved in cellulose biosynthesis